MSTSLPSSPDPGSPLPSPPSPPPRGGWFRPKHARLEPPGRALVTGASSGIGAAIARELGARGWELVLTARSLPALESLAREVGEGRPDGPGARVHVLAAELSDPGAPAWLEERTEGAGLPVDLLVNNAGFGYAGPFLAQDPGRMEAMVQVNLTAVMALSRRFGAHMAGRGRGGILQVASTAAFQPGPLMAVYYATKAGVVSFSEALREELREAGVTVTCLCPGVTRTPFHDRAGMDGERLRRRVPWQEAEVVAHLGVEGVLAGRGVVIPGRLNRILATAVRLVPRSILPGLVRKVQESRMGIDER